MKFSLKDILPWLAFFGLASYQGWKDLHDSYIDKKIQEEEHDKIVKQLVEGDLLNEQKKLNRLILKRLDTIAINYKDITILFNENKAQDSHIKELEKFNSQWGYKY